MFVVCGEALMDVFSTGSTPTGVSLDARIGGSPFNVAVGLARLAQPVAFFGGVSSGFLGERLVAAMQAERVDTRALHVSSAPTTLGLVGLDAAGVPSYAFYGHGAADREVPVEALQRVPADAAVIHVGSFNTVVEPVAGTLRALVEREHRRCLISYDPNIRLNVEPDVVRWREQLQWMLPRTHLLKVSDEDLALLYPGVAHEALARQWLAAGVALVVVTRGAQGAIGWTASAQAEAKPVVVTVIDTVGAGDTFQAALLTWLAERDSLSGAAIAALASTQLGQALDFAAKAAAITCSRRGADLPRRDEL
ncbi:MULTISPECIES: carbohydrate kinase [unclassified Rhizobacter]|uniref:carbohydrate kinase family protein n=1 Tax=unclassified Rhizobacter TaxID=2640088 RepID=UPI0006F6EF5B|nr:MULTISPECIES: carbohydrate kinase [unclassified Rhizobacter]KQU78470.1 fructokinase [Rhizobacter sp. Root29]KQW10990.1 fructokinase [Rhizobacter sp. Root1238]KRB25336.1 fructokinase [Rhizobacter sp. Root16D2]